MTYILWSSDFALYNEDYLMMNIVIWDYDYDLMFDLKIKVGRLTIISWSSDFALYLEDLLDV